MLKCARGFTKAERPSQALRPPSPGLPEATISWSVSSRKRQLQFLLEGRGRRAGLSPEELRDNGRLLGEGLSRALFNYPSRDCAGSPEVGPGPAWSPDPAADTSSLTLLFCSQEAGVASSERRAMVQDYLQHLVRRASDTNLKGEALHKLWPSIFAEMVRDSVLDMRDRAAFRRASLAKMADRK